MTSSPGGGDNNPPYPGEPPLNGYTTAPKSTITSCCLIGPEWEEPAGQVHWRLDCLPSVDRLARSDLHGLLLQLLVEQGKSTWHTQACRPPATLHPHLPLTHLLPPHTCPSPPPQDQSHTFTLPTVTHVAKCNSCASDALWGHPQSSSCSGNLWGSKTGAEFKVQGYPAVCNGTPFPLVHAVLHQAFIWLQRQQLS